MTPQSRPAQGGREEISPQLAVWVEDSNGKWLQDLFVTRSVGFLGLGNRPGQALLKSDFHWPYGRRPMALPIWAFRRGKQYGMVVMGGKCSRDWNPALGRGTVCPNDFQGSPCDDDMTVAYHGPVSSTENFYCSPSGWRTQKMGGVDVVSCASSFFGSKGFYAPGMTSPYPPRADLTMMGAGDHPDSTRFARDNDVAAISGATPTPGQPMQPVRWFTTGANPDGDYTIWVEAHTESDFNPSWPPGKEVDEPHSEWNYLGKPFIGQPSVVYKVPFRLDTSGRVATTLDYAGYAASWKGENGNINQPDATISQSGGSGGDRLKTTVDESGTWRVKVSVTPCDAASCAMPQPVTAIDLSERTDSTLTLKFKIPEGPQALSYEVRYQQSGPITAENWDRATPAHAANLGAPGSTASARIEMLLPKTRYYVAVRPLSRCGEAGPVLSGEVDTGTGNYATLSGCFIATAAYGSEMEPHVARLQRFRDQRLLKSPLGRAAIVSYYALSPGLATVISQHEGLRAAARRVLSPLVSLASAIDP